MENYRQKFSEFLLDIYGQVEFVPTHGIGSRLYDANNREIIDFTAGIAVNALGHAHPDLINTLTIQAQKLWHCSNILVNRPAVDLAEYLITHSVFDKAFFCNSGTEANEAALKLARRFAKINFGEHKHKIVSFKNSFHGRTLFSVSAGGQPQYSEDFAPLPSGIVHGIYNDLSSASELIDDSTAAVILEPIQAEGGIIVAKQEFLQQIRALCDKHNAILIFDEVQTGVGRTGKLFAYEHFDIEPDVISLAKALGCGFPIGAILVKDKFSHGFAIGSHGTTFGGNPLACSVALTGLQIINTPEFLANVQNTSQVFKDYLQKINSTHNIYSEIRGIGLLIGAELVDHHKGNSKKIMQAGFDNGIATLIASANVTRFTPPLNINHADITEGFTRFENAVNYYLNFNNYDLT